MILSAVRSVKGQASRGEMKKKNQGRKKPTIFKIFLFSLIGIMLIQSMITISTLVVRRTGKMLEEYSSGRRSP